MDVHISPPRIAPFGLQQNLSLPLSVLLSTSVGISSPSSLLAYRYYVHLCPLTPHGATRIAEAFFPVLLIAYNFAAHIMVVVSLCPASARSSFISGSTLHCDMHIQPMTLPSYKHARHVIIITYYRCLCLPSSMPIQFRLPQRYLPGRRARHLRRNRLGGAA